MLGIIHNTPVALEKGRTDGWILDNQHFLKCRILNSGTERELEINNLLNGTLKQKIEVYKKMKENMNKMNVLINSTQWFSLL